MDTSCCTDMLKGLTLNTRGRWTLATAVVRTRSSMKQQTCLGSSDLTIPLYAVDVDEVECAFKFFFMFYVPSLDGYTKLHPIDLFDFLRPSFGTSKHRIS